MTSLHVNCSLAEVNASVFIAVFYKFLRIAYIRLKKIKISTIDLLYMQTFDKYSIFGHIEHLIL